MPKIKNNVRTIQAGIWNHKCKVYEILQMLRWIEFPLRFIWLDDRKLGILIFGIFKELFLTVVVLMSTYKNSLRTIGAEIS